MKMVINDDSTPRKKVVVYREHCPHNSHSAMTGECFLCFGYYENPPRPAYFVTCPDCDGEMEIEIQTKADETMAKKCHCWVDDGLCVARVDECGECEGQEGKDCPECEGKGIIFDRVVRRQYE